jgi:Predicted permease, DMT superfamily
MGLFFLSAIFEPFLYFIGESYGLVRVAPTICSAIIATIPLFAPFAAFIFLKEKIGKWNIFGFVVSFLGVILMLFNNQLQFTASASGLMFLFGAVVVAVCYSITLKKLTYRYSALTIVAVQNTIGIFYFLPFVLLTERTYLPDILLIRQYIVPLLLLGVLASSIAYVLYTYSVEKIGVARSNVYTNMIPIFTLVFSYILIHEQITSFKIAGILIVIFGLILSQVKPKSSIKNDYQ